MRLPPNFRLRCAVLDIWSMDLGPAALRYGVAARSPGCCARSRGVRRRTSIRCFDVARSRRP